MVALLGIAMFARRFLSNQLINRTAYALCAPAAGAVTDAKAEG